MRTCEEVCRVSLDPSARATVAAAFSPDGELLVTVGADNQHTVQIWDWKVPGAGVGDGGKVVGCVGQGGVVRVNTRRESTYSVILPFLNVLFCSLGELVDPSA